MMRRRRSRRRVETGKKSKPVAGARAGEGDGVSESDTTWTIAVCCTPTYQ
jgi:hypothetical protein